MFQHWAVPSLPLWAFKLLRKPRAQTSGDCARGTPLGVLVPAEAKGLREGSRGPAGTESSLGLQGAPRGAQPPTFPEAERGSPVNP